MKKLLYFVLLSLFCSAILIQSGRAQAKPTRVRVSSGVEEQLLIKRVNPNYPKEARKEKVEGRVILRVKIDTKGNVVDTEVASGPC